jgi:hypothetical protein
LDGHSSVKPKRWDTDRDYGWMRQRKFIKTTGDKITAPFNPDGSPNVFLPVGSLVNEKTVKISLLESPEVMEFFKHLDISEPELLDTIERDIFQKYALKTDLNADVAVDGNINDIARILEGITNTENEKKRALFINKLSDIAFIAGTDGISELTYYKPGELCLDNILENPRGLSYFFEIHGKHEVWPGYKEAHSFSSPLK